MLSTVSEKKLHAIRWVVFLAWALLIASLFYDPISAVLTDPKNDWSWLADNTIAIAHNSDKCISTQGYCIPLEPYAIGTRVFWGMVVPSAIFVVLVFGHEFWRRICPLYFFSQLPRALGLQPLLNIERNLWLQQNHFYVQFALFFIGLNGRILLVNSARPIAGLFFIFTLLMAAIVVALYGGRSWCHYICPFGMVQTVFTGPRGLLDSQAHQAQPYSLTQSMCRTLDPQGQSQSDCVSCKSSCMDIDAEQSYWDQLHKPGRRLVQYGYLGLVIGYFCYYALYSGNFSYYFSGVWSHEPVTMKTLMGPGFYLFQEVIAIPKCIAAPLSLATFAAASGWICTRIERYYRGYLKQYQPGAAADSGLHRMFSICTFLAFNIFFIYGGRPEINNFPVAAQFGFQASIAVLSSLWLYRTWGRSQAQYQKESMADRLRRQLKKLSVNEHSVNQLLATPDEAKTIEQLSVDELSILARTLPNLSSSTVEAPDDDELALPKTALPKTVMNRGQLTSSQKTTLPKTQLRKR
ncbi:MAG: 4Fe-4S binding protein [Phormidesmis sp.]